MTTTDPLLREVDERLAEMTPGEWIAGNFPPNGWTVYWRMQDGPICHMRWTDGLRPEVEARLKAEAQFIAASPRLLRALRDRLVTAEAERHRLRHLCAATYQMAGAYDAPTRFLDALSRAANGTAFELTGLLPVDGPARALKRAEPAEARIAALEQALAVIHTAARGDEKSECWTIRRWLDDHDVFNDDLSGSERLIAEVCKAALTQRPTEDR